MGLELTTTADLLTELLRRHDNAFVVLGGVQRTVGVEDEYRFIYRVADSSDGLLEEAVAYALHQSGMYEED